MGDDPACTRCWHDRSAHGRYRAGMDCSACDNCRRFRPDPPLTVRYRQWQETRELARAERLRAVYPRYVIVGYDGTWSAAHLDSRAAFGPARTVRKLGREIVRHDRTIPAAPEPRQEPRQEPVTPPSQPPWETATMLDMPALRTPPYADGRIGTHRGEPQQ